MIVDQIKISVRLGVKRSRFAIAAIVSNAILLVDQYSTGLAMWRDKDSRYSGIHALENCEQDTWYFVPCSVQERKNTLETDILRITDNPPT